MKTLREVNSTGQPEAILFIYATNSFKHHVDRSWMKNVVYPLVSFTCIRIVNKQLRSLYLPRSNWRNWFCWRRWRENRFPRYQAIPLNLQTFSLCRWRRLIPRQAENTARLAADRNRADFEIEVVSITEATHANAFLLLFSNDRSTSAKRVVKI